MRAFRPFRYWLPETLNRLRLPGFIMRQRRRDEVAAVFRQAKRDGIKLRRDCCIFGPMVRRVLKRAPAKAAAQCDGCKALSKIAHWETSCPSNVAGCAGTIADSTQL